MSPAAPTPKVFLGGLFLSRHGGMRSPIEDLADRLIACGWSVTCSSSIRNGLLRGANVIQSLITRRSEYQVAVIDLFSGRAFLWGEAAGRLLSAMRVPFIYSLHGGGLPEFSASRADRMKRCLARAAAVTAPSRYLLQKMRPYRPDISLLPNALEARDYPFRLRRDLKPQLVWVRRFHEIYNPAMAVEVLATVAKAFPGATLTMLGKDSGDGTYQRVQQLARDRGVLAQIQFTGGVPREKVSEYVEQADIFLNTTNIDNTPVSVLEALAGGVCVVTTDAGGLPYLLDHGIDALLTPCGDAVRMASEVIRLLRDPVFAGRLSENARRKALTFDWDTVLLQWKQLLSRVSGVAIDVNAPCLAPHATEGL